MHNLILAAELMAYLFAGRMVMRHLAGFRREVVFAGLNLAAVYYFLFYGNHSYYTLRFGIYLLLVVGQFLMLRWFVGRGGGWPWLAFFTPIVALIFFRYLPDDLMRAAVSMVGLQFRGLPMMIGLSYLAFRCSRLVLEVRNGSVKAPNLVEYLNFAFFLPTMSVGPINTYANFRRGFDVAPLAVPVLRAVLRILVGLVKYQFLGNLCNKLGYTSLLLDDHPHHWIDLPVAMVAYFLFLYCNFSGFCDMAIGAAGIIGIPVPENFENPLAARNIKEFWNRWHITLSMWMRDVVFSPLSKFLVRAGGPKFANHAVALTIVVVFLLVGIWHGAGWNFVAYGATQALGVATTHYWTIFLKTRLGRDRFKTYNENRFIHALAVATTFCFMAVSLMFFANSFPQLKEIWSVLR